jgi:hypothetical protein
MRVRFLLLLSLLALFTGCAAPPGKPMPDSWKDPANSGELVLYRTKSWIMQVRNTYFYVDGVHIATLGSFDYTVVTLPAGVHRLTEKWDWDLMAKDMVIDVPVRAGAKSYVRVAQSGSDVTYSSPAVIRFGWRLEVVPESVGSSEIQGMDARPPVNAGGR